MATLVIPEEHYAGIAAIRDLPEESIEELIAELKGQPSTFDRAQLRSNVRGSIESATPDEVDAAMDTLISLYVVRQDENVPIDAFVDDVVEAMDESRDDWLSLSGDRRQRFRDRLTKSFRH
jgi:hypothetical protein